MTREVDRIGLKLGSLRALWRQLGGPPPSFADRPFVSDPPVAIEVVESFESRLGVRLPDDYREFVTRVSGSGLGPGTGLLALDDPTQWRACSRETPPREPGRFAYASHSWGGWVYTALVGPRRGTLWIDTEDGVLPIGPSGEPSTLRAEPIGFVEWYDRWLDHAIEADKTFAERSSEVTRMRQVVAAAMAPKRVEISEAFRDASDAEECWERLGARGLVDLELDRRVFVERCPAAVSGRAKHERTCVACAGAGRVEGPRPSTVSRCLSVASMWPSMMAAERLAREFAVRLSEWGVAPAPDALLRWTPWKEPDPRRRTPVDVPRPAARELDRALALTIRADGRSGAWLRALQELSARVAGVRPSLATRFALDVDVSLQLVERAQRERRDASVDALAVYTPFEPLAFIARLGFALVHVDAESIELAAPL